MFDVVKVVIGSERAREFLIQRQKEAMAAAGGGGGCVDVAAVIDSHPLYTPVMMCIEGKACLSTRGNSQIEATRRSLSTEYPCTVYIYSERHCTTSMSFHVMPPHKVVKVGRMILLLLPVSNFLSHLVSRSSLTYFLPSSLQE